jgi:hypothetical protein
MTAASEIGVNACGAEVLVRLSTNRRGLEELVFFMEKAGGQLTESTGVGAIVMIVEGERESVTIGKLAPSTRYCCVSMDWITTGM